MDEMENVVEAVKETGKATIAVVKSAKEAGRFVLACAAGFIAAFSIGAGTALGMKTVLGVNNAKVKGDEKTEVEDDLK